MNIIKVLESFRDITSWGNFFPSSKNKLEEENNRRMKEKGKIYTGS